MFMLTVIYMDYGKLKFNKEENMAKNCDLFETDEKGFICFMQKPPHESILSHRTLFRGGSNEVNFNSPWRK